LELNNLALDPKKNGDLLGTMNTKLNKLIDAEVGEDLGQMLPGGVDGAGQQPLVLVIEGS